MSFKIIYNYLTKGSLLEDAFETSDDIHDETHNMFQHATKCLIDHNIELKDEVIKADRKVNKGFIDIRRKIFEYLSISAAPNISACLILSNVAIDYERIGDYCKNIAQLIDSFPVKFEEGVYKQNIIEMTNRIDRMFNNTKEAMNDEKEEQARKVIEDHSKIKEIHGKIVESLNNDKDITVKEAIVIAKMGGYLRRVSAHLGNICTGVIRPFPKMGFLGKSMKDELYSREKLD